MNDEHIHTRLPLEGCAISRNALTFNVQLSLEPLEPAAILSHLTTMNSVVSRALLSMLLTGPAALPAATVTNIPATDTFISIHWTGPNGGGLDMVVGTQGLQGGFSPNRGLVKFDLSNIPSGAQINSVTFDLTIVRSPNAPASTFELRRMLRDWSEDSSTWEARTATDSWGVPGGQEGLDYVATISGTASMGNVIGVTHTFASTANMVADVTRWLTNAAENHGWLIKTEDEEVALSARRVGSSEGSSPPRLVVNYTAAPPRPVITGVSRDGAEFCVHFQASPGKTYVLERRISVDAGDWTQVATVPGSDGPATLCDPFGAANAFYRIGEQ